MLIFLGVTVDSPHLFIRLLEVIDSFRLQASSDDPDVWLPARSGFLPERGLNIHGSLQANWKVLAPSQNRLHSESTATEKQLPTRQLP